MGVPPNHPFIDRFSIINQPFLDPPFMETPIYGWNFGRPASLGRLDGEIPILDAVE